MKTFSSWLLLVIKISYVYSKLAKRELPEVSSCPKNWENSICSCDVDKNTLSSTVSCQNVNELQLLNDVLNPNRINGKKDVFLLKNSNLPKLPDGMLKQMSFTGIIIKDNNVGRINRFAFQGSELSADSIRITGNKFSEGFDIKFLRPLRQLVSVIITNNNLLTIAKGEFGSLPRLEILDLQKNNLEELGKFAFIRLPKLKRIDLSWNKLTHLEKQMFNTHETENPIALSLMHNLIDQIDDDAFFGLKANFVNLQFNKLTTLNEKAFESLLDFMSSNQKSKLLLEGNNLIKCDSSDQWITSKPLKYRDQITGNPCNENKAKARLKNRPKSMNQCLFKPISKQLVAFYKGNNLDTSVSVPHLAKISLRCRNVQNQKFVGQHQLQCIDGEFNNLLPNCVGLRPNSPFSAPPLWLTTNPFGNTKVNEEGVVMVPRNSQLNITCLWSRGKPAVTVFGDVEPSSQKQTTFNRITGWTTTFDNIQKIASIDYQCGIPGSEPGGELTQTLRVKVSDICPSIEERIQLYGLLIDPLSKKSFYSEEDRVNLMCGGKIKRGIRYAICKNQGIWEWGPEEDCSERETNVFYQ